LLNTATYYGGGIYVSGSANVNFTKSTLQQNSGSLGGGLYCASSGSITSTEDTIINNNQFSMISSVNNVFCVQPCFSNAICCLNHSLTEFDKSKNCSDCLSPFYGSTCSNQCLTICNNGTCSTGINGTGTCICDDDFDPATNCVAEIAYSNDDNNIGAIVAGVIVPICIITLIIVIYFKFHKTSKKDYSDDGPSTKVYSDDETFTKVSPLLIKSVILTYRKARLRKTAKSEIIYKVDRKNNNFNLNC